MRRLPTPRPSGSEQGLGTSARIDGWTVLYHTTVAPSPPASSGSSASLPSARSQRENPQDTDRARAGTPSAPSRTYCSSALPLPVPPLPAADRRAAPCKPASVPLSTRRPVAADLSRIALGPPLVAPLAHAGPPAIQPAFLDHSQQAKLAEFETALDLASRASNWGLLLVRWGANFSAAAATRIE